MLFVMGRKRQARHVARHTSTFGYGLLLSSLFLMGFQSICVTAQTKKPPKGVIARSVSSTLPSGYMQVGSTQLFYNYIYYYDGVRNIDVQGFYSDAYYGSTYGNGGYKVAISVNDSTAQRLDCQNGQTINGVTFSAKVEQQGELAKVLYVLNNTTEEDVTISLGVYADVMIGNNDRAPLSRRVDATGNTYGITMKDGNGAQLCVLFGSGLAGVTPISDYWFGYYSQNSDAEQIVGNYYQGSNWMEENGSYDSGMGWCWKNRKIAAGDSVTLSYLIGVGDVDLSPKSDFVATPENPDAWNDLSLPHKLTLEGKYESPAGLDGKIEYAVEDETEWHALTDMMPSGTEFTSSVVAQFDTAKTKHVIHFRTVDNVDNTTLLASIEYLDVKYINFEGIENHEYNGDPQYQTNLTSSLDKEQFTTQDYWNNVNAGTAHFKVAGVFPYTIGYHDYTFSITPKPFAGEILLEQDQYTYIGQPIRPNWSFSEDWMKELVQEGSYSVAYANDLKPGTGTIIIEGKNNYSGTLTKNFTINKAAITNNLYEVVMPEEDVCYDDEEHTPTVRYAAENLGDIAFTYTYHGEDSLLASAPKEEGAYDVYMEIAESDCYYGLGKTMLGSFSIYQLDDAEWLGLQELNTSLIGLGAKEPWDLTLGKKVVKSLHGVTVKQGHIVKLDLHDQGLQGSCPATFSTLSHLTSLDLSYNELTGNVGELAAPLTELECLNVSHNRFSEVSPVISDKVRSLDISHQDIEQTLEVNYSHDKAADVLNQVPSILRYDHDNHQTYKLYVSLSFLSGKEMGYVEDGIEPDFTCAISDSSLSFFGSDAYKGENGAVVSVASHLDGSKMKMKLSFDKGDCNFLPGVNVSDLQWTIRYCYNDLNGGTINITAADTYTDSVINVQDVVATANIILEQDASGMYKSKANLAVHGIANAMSGIDDCSNEENNANAESAVYVKNGKVFLLTQRPVAALCLNASGKVNWDLTPLGLTQATKGNKVVAYSFADMTIPAGEHVIGTCDASTRILSADLTDRDANEMKTAINSAAVTRIGGMEADADHNATYYNIAGQRVGKRHKGVVIVSDKTGCHKRVNRQ